MLIVNRNFIVVKLQQGMVKTSLTDFGWILYKRFYRHGFDVGCVHNGLECTVRRLQNLL